MPTTKKIIHCKNTNLPKPPTNQPEMLIFVLLEKLFLHHIQFFSFYLDYGYAFHALLWKLDVNRCGITILISNCQLDQSAVTTETDGEESVKHSCGGAVCC